MEEADARLQEVVASLLNEHGGNHEPALRQTFACLHNSGLYEAQSPQEEEQREQQVLAVFRSFPFRATAPAAPVDNGVGSRVEETQAPPPAYNTLVREPEEAGEIAAAPADPENVGEDAGAQPVAGEDTTAQPAPEALLPLNPTEDQQGQRTPAPGPEVSHQGASSSPIPQPPPAGADASSQQGSAEPEGFAASGRQPGVGVGAVAVEGLSSATVEGVEEAKGGELGGAAGGRRDGFPEAGEEGTGGAAVVAGGRGAAGSGQEGEAKENGVGITSGEGEGSSAGLGAAAASGNGELAVGDDPESTRQANYQGEEQHTIEARQQRQSEHPHVNGEGNAYYFGAVAAGPAAAAGIIEENMDVPGSSDGLAAAASAGASAGPGAMAAMSAAGAARAGAGAGPMAATTASVTESHLRTGGQGQPLSQANRAESPTGMSTELQDKLKALKLRRKHRFLVMRIDATEVVADAVGAPGEGPEQLRVALPYSDCRYAVYDQEIVTADGRKANKLFFFTWLPHNATPHNKMAYSHGKVTVRQRLEGLYDVAASSFADIESALGLVDEDEEDSDIDF